MIEGAHCSIVRKRVYTHQTCKHIQHQGDANHGGGKLCSQHDLEVDLPLYKINTLTCTYCMHVSHF